MYGTLEKKARPAKVQKPVTPDTEIPEDFGVRGLDRPARPAEIVPIESSGLDNLAVEPIKLTETQERSESHPERNIPAEGQEQEEDQWEPQEVQEHEVKIFLNRRIKRGAISLTCLCKSIHVCGSVFVLFFFVGYLNNTILIWSSILFCEANVDFNFLSAI